MQVFSRALNVSEAELFKMMEQGQLVSSEVLPKVAAELKKAALEGGAFEKALKGLKVTEGQLGTDFQRAGKKIFNSGFEDGMSEMYKTLSDIIKDAGPQLEKLGDIFGKVFRGIAHGFRILEPYMKVAIDNFWTLFGAAAISRVVAMGAALRTTFLPLTAAVVAAEELASLMSDSLVGSIEKKMGMQVNLLDRTTSGLERREDGKYYGDGKKKEFFGLGSVGSYGLDIMDKLNPYTSGSTAYANLSNMVNGSGATAAEVIRQGNGASPQTTSVTIQNTFNNADATQMIRYNDIQQVMHGIGVSK